MAPHSMRVRSFAKLNLALAVIARRSDGYHEIRTVFQSIDLHDDLEIRPCARIEVHCAGPGDIPEEENTVRRAAIALSQAASPPSGAEILLTKRIPVGAGLGGGSSNAAAALLGLRKFWEIRISETDLRSLAASIGSDVPFFLRGGTSLGIGRGEEIYPLEEIQPAHLVIIFPGVHISTAAAYQSLQLQLTSVNALHKIQSFCGHIGKDPRCLAGIFNDFETSILPAYPAVKEAKDFLLERGATTAMLSGSGSSVFGFFSDEESALAVSRNPMARGGWRVFPAKTLSRAEYFQSMFG